MHPSFWLDALGTQIRQESVGGYETRWIEAGEGPPLILLHGLSGHAETWIRNVGPLAASYHVYALDMLGHGLSAKPAIEYSIGALAAHVRAFMDAHDIATANFIGQSLGGWVSAAIVLEHPDRVISWVSATGAGLQLSDDAAALTQRIGAQVKNATSKAVNAPTLESVRTRLEWLMHDKSLVTDELVAARHYMYTQPGYAEVAPRIIDSVTTSVDGNEVLTSEKLARIACPTLILWTRQNPTMPWEVGKQASEIIPGAQFYLMEDAGHWPQFEKPDEFHDVVLPFLARANRI